MLCDNYFDNFIADRIGFSYAVWKYIFSDEVNTTYDMDLNIEMVGNIGYTERLTKFIKNLGEQAHDAIFNLNDKRIPITKDGKKEIWSMNDFVDHMINGPVIGKTDDGKRDLTSTVVIDGKWMMEEGAGKFVSIKQVYESTTVKNIMKRTGIPDGSYKLTDFKSTGELYQPLDKKVDKIVLFSNYSSASLDGSWVSRSYVQGTSAFKSEGDVIIKNGIVQSIKNITLVPKDDNFDFDYQKDLVVDSAKYLERAVKGIPDVSKQYILKYDMSGVPAKNVGSFDRSDYYAATRNVDPSTPLNNQPYLYIPINYDPDGIYGENNAQNTDKTNEYRTFSKEDSPESEDVGYKGIYNENNNPYELILGEELYGKLSEIPGNFIDYLSGKYSWLDLNNIFICKPISPIILDLNGDGIRVTNVNFSSAYFDMLGNGQLQKTSWASGKDGILYIDKNNDGIPTDINELFENKEGEGFASLAVYDSNNDGLIDSTDTQYGDLRIWIDKNENGVAEKGELYDLEYLGIKNINLQANTQITYLSGNKVISRGSFTYDNGETHDMVDVLFNVNTLDTKTHAPEGFAEYELNVVIPDIKGTGFIAPIRYEAWKDDSITVLMMSLKNSVENNLYDLVSTTEDKILMKLSHVEYDYNDTRNSYSDDWKLKVVESFYGRKLIAKDIFGIEGSDIGFNADTGNTISQYYDSIKESYFQNVFVYWYGSNMDTQSVSNIYSSPYNTFYSIDGYELVNDLNHSISYFTDKLLKAEYIDKGETLNVRYIQQFINLVWNAEYQDNPRSDRIIYSDIMNEVDYFIRNNMSPEAVNIGRIYDQFLQIKLYQKSENYTVSTSSDVEKYISGSTGMGLYSFTEKESNDIYVYIKGEKEIHIDETQPYRDGGRKDTVVFAGLLTKDVDIIIENGDYKFSVNNIEIVNIKDQGRGNPKIEKFVFADKSYSIYDLNKLYIRRQIDSKQTEINGTNNDDKIEPGKDNQTIKGNHGVNTFVYNHGDGHDRILPVTNEFNANGIGNLVLHGIAPADVVVDRPGHDIRLSFPDSSAGAGDAGSITLLAATEFLNRILLGTITFDDGTVWTLQDAFRHAMEDQQTAGNDAIVGTPYDDVITGGHGDDAMQGNAGTNTFVYSRGDGNDRAYGGDDQYITGGVGQVVLHGITPADLRVERVGVDLKLTIPDSGTNDAGSFTMLANPEYFNRIQFSTITFDDGTVWTLQDAFQKAFEQQMTPGNDVITGTDANDLLIGGHGDDVFYGSGGTDTYGYSRGDGDDIIRGHTGFNPIGPNILALHGLTQADVQFRTDGTNLTVVVPESAQGSGDAGSIKILANVDYFNQSAIKTITFDDGTSVTIEDAYVIARGAQATNGDDVVYGTDGDDVLAGGHGDDLLIGRAGHDTYVYARGDGRDTIRDGGPIENQIVLHGIDPAAVHYTAIDRSLLITIDPSSATANDGGQILVEASTSYSRETGLVSITFDDGTVQDRNTIFGLITDVTGSDTNEDVVGTDKGGILWGKGGDDRLIGNGGADNYVFGRGDGHDIVAEHSNDGTENTLLLHGYTASEVTVTGRGYLGEVTLSMQNGADTVLLENEGTPPWTAGVKHVAFDDGTIWTRDDLRFKAFVDGDPSHPVTLDTGIYTNQTAFVGGSGDTIYIVDAGLPALTIADHGGQDTLVLRGVDQAHVGFTLDSQTQDLVINIHDVPGRADSSIKVANGLGLTGIESFTFSDGTMTAAQVQDWITTHHEAA